MINDERVKELACTIYGKHGPQSLYEIAMVEGAERAILIAVAEAEAVRQEACAVVVEKLARFYPTTIFSEPPPGEHGKTIDACSARAIRCALPGIASAIRAYEESDED